MKKLMLLIAIALATYSAPRNLVDFEHTNLVDLTHPFDEHTLYWPTSPSGFELKKRHASRCADSFLGARPHIG